MDDVMVGRRDRKKSQTRQSLRSAALRLALEQGYEHLTVEAITEAADVSLRTFFNHFASKDDALLGPDPERSSELAELLAARPADEPPMTALRAAVLELADSYAEHAGLWEARRELLQANPQLWPRMVSVFAGFERSLTEAIAARTGTDPEAVLYPGVAAAAVMGAMRVAVAHWRASNPAAAGSDLRALLSQAFDLLTAGLPAPAPAGPGLARRRGTDRNGALQ